MPKSVRYELCVWFVVNVRARNVTVPMPFVRGGHCTKELFSWYSASSSGCASPMPRASTVSLSRRSAEKFSDPESPSGESKR